jgi:hypothetical protein
VNWAVNHWCPDVEMPNNLKMNTSVTITLQLLCLLLLVPDSLVDNSN